MHRTLLLIFFFVSGTSGLVFEVIWSRMLTQVFGSTTFALSALLTAFMSGLALGSEWAGRRAKDIKRPLRLYGILEGGIGLYALLVPILLGLLPGLYRPLFQNLYDNFYLFSLLRFGMVFLVLLVPATFMGATLPLLAEYVSRLGGDWEGGSGQLYGMNTFGACVGTLACSFALLPNLGLTLTNTAVAILSMSLCVTVLAVDALLEKRGLNPPETPAPTPDDDTRALIGDDPEQHLAPWMMTAILVLFAAAGGISMTYQVLWTRAYVIILGSSTYSFGLILATFLVGLAGGSAVMASALRFVRKPVFVLAATQLGVCVFASVCFFALNAVPELLFEHMRTEARSPANVYIYNVFLIALVVFLPTFLQGMSFPLVVRIVSDFARRRRDEGQDVDAGGLVGRAYAINTVGAIVGSFASGFILMPLMGLRYAMALTLVLNLLVGAAFAAISLKVRVEQTKLWVVGPAALIALSMMVLGPELDLTRLSSGAFRVYWAKELFTPDSFRKDKPEVLFYRDGVAATITVEKRGHLITLKSNGKPEASNDADMATQILVGLLPMVMHESTQTARDQIAAGTYEGPKDVAMVGFGSGVTAGASLTWPLERLDVVEIEAAMLDASLAFDEVNHRPLTDKRLRAIESDGRNFLEYTGDDYDVIISEPSNPWIAGVASLFTEEHFERARRKLKPGGVFCQWVQLYELRPENVGRIFKTFSAVFPHVQVYSSMAKGTDLILIGSNEPIALRPEGFPRAFGDASVAEELRRAGVEDAMDIYALAFLDPTAVAPFIKDIETDLGHEIILNTDDNGILEFEAPRDLIQYKQADQFFAGIYYRDKLYGDLRPTLEDFDDPQVWDADALAALSYATYSMGKQRLAGMLAREAQRRGPTTLGRLVEQVWTIYDAGPDDFARDHWPAQDTLISKIVRSGLDQESSMPALEIIYSREERDGHAFKDPEATLASALFLYKARDYKNALKQLDRLRADGGAIAQAPLVDLLLGFTHTRRRRYQEAFADFARFYGAVYTPAMPPDADRTP